MRCALCLSLAVLLESVCLGAQTEAPGGSSPTVQELVERIQKLEQRIQELENKQPAGQPAPVAATAPAEQAAKAPPPHEHGATVSAESLATEAQPRYPSLAIRGFTDIDFAAQDKKGTTSGFSLGQFVFHLSGALSEKVSYFGELSWTATPSGYNAEVERSIIRYDYNDHLKVSFGRYHTPVNYWNTAFHHGLWLQTTVSRPEMIQFGGRLIPVHFVGALVEGTVPGTRSLNLNYNLGLGNGRGSIISRGGDAGDINNHRAYLANLFVRPDWAYGWQAGGSIYRDKITLAPNRNFTEWIESAHLVYTKERPELLAEFANIHHTRLETPGSFDSQAWYIQFAYRLPWFEKEWKPYYRFEYIHIPKSDPVFNPTGNALPSLAGSVVGMRYDLTSYAAFKAEYRNSRREPSQPRVNAVFVQTSLTF